MRHSAARSARPLALLALAIGGAPSAMGAQVPDSPAVALASDSPAVAFGRRVTLRSAVLGEDRPVLIHLPASYARSPDARYPVLYLLDGDLFFASTAAMVDELSSYADRIPELIVVAVPNRNRTRDLSPPARETRMVVPVLAGRDTFVREFPPPHGAADFRRFLTRELRAWVDSTYRTTPYRILVGHSRGGVFALDALAEEPDAFRAVIALSPALWWDGGRFGPDVARRLRDAPLGDAAVYLAAGGEEPDELIVEPTRSLGDALARRPAPFRSTARVLPSATHSSTPLHGTLDALEWLFAGWATPDSLYDLAAVEGTLAPLDAHRAGLARMIGVPAMASAEQVSNAVFGALGLGRPEAAVRLAREGARRYPNDAGMHAELADALDAAGDATGALAAQQEALRVAERTSHPRTEWYRRALERRRSAGTP